MEVLKNQIANFIETELSQNQINSFKWGNSPSEETLLHSLVIKLAEHIEVQYFGRNNKKIKKEDLVNEVHAEVQIYSTVQEFKKAVEALYFV